MTTTTPSTPSCFSCDSDLPFGAGYCPGCGVAVDDSVMMLDLLGDDPVDEQVGAALPTKAGRGSHQAVGSVEAKQPGNRRVVAAIGVLAAVLLGWLFLRTPLTTLDGVSDALAVPGSDIDEGDEEDNTSSQLDPAVSELEFDAVELNGGAPVLGQQLGLDLYVTSGSTLARINLDTGATSVFDVDGQPVAVTGQDLLLLSNQKILTVDLADPEGQTRLVYDLPINSSADLPELAVVDEDRLVMTFQSFGPNQVRQTTTVLNLASGEAETIDLPSSAFSRFGLVWVPGGGTFDYVNGEFVKVFDGSVFSAGPDSGLGYRCERPGQCGLQLFDRRTGDVIDSVSLPAVDEPWFVQQIPGSDRLLAVLDAGFGPTASSEVRLYDMSTGEFLPTGLLPPGESSNEGYIDDPQQIASWDERLVAVGFGDTIRVQDVANEIGWTVQLEGLTERPFGQPDRLFFVPR